MKIISINIYEAPMVMDRIVLTTGLEDTFHPGTNLCVQFFTHKGRGYEYCRKNFQGIEPKVHSIVA